MSPRASKSTTSEPTEYTLDDEAGIVDALPDDPPDDDVTGAEIVADVEWSGTFNPRPHRTLRASRLVGMGEVREAARAAKRPPEGARLPSYRDKGWHAQFVRLTSTAAGREALGQHLRVTGPTMLAWLAEQREPTRANQAAIARAYEQRATDPAATARSQSRAAHRLADSLSDAFRRTYGAEVRITNITDWRWT
jgi:hypothetical protein